MQNNPKEITKEAILSNIKHWRESKDIKESIIGKALGIQQSAYSKKENGVQEFTLTELLTLSNFLNVGLQKIIGFDFGKWIHQENNDNATGFVENQYTSLEGFKLCIEQYKNENEYLKKQIEVLLKK